MLPDPICWTQAPPNLKSLKRQRIRWQQGLVETLRSPLVLLTSDLQPSVRWFALPYLYFFEVLGPWIEALGYLSVSVSLFFGWADWHWVGSILSLGIALSIGITLLSVHLEQSHYARHHSKKDLIPFLFASIFETLGYRQLTWWWRLEAMMRLPFRKKRIWLKAHRQNIQRSA
jgi:cellulose synthase/poly-beta-1,6-N-acetylglucosamine synthase-like glycosyltransferase